MDLWSGILLAIHSELMLWSTIVYTLRTEFDISLQEYLDKLALTLYREQHILLTKTSLNHGWKTYRPAFWGKKFLGFYRLLVFKDFRPTKKTGRKIMTHEE